MRLGTRGSALARTQSGQVAAAITAATGVAVELVIFTTRGDRIVDRPLPEIGGKGLFTAELEQALVSGDIDLAVHSFKDMPTESPRGLVFGAVPPRVDPSDVLVGATLDALPQGAVVGTGSVRRRLQLQAVRPDLDIRGIRGNVDSRIEKVRRGEYQAIVLAAAGIERLGRGAEITQRLGVDQMVPAPAQGALAVQCRADDARTLSLLSRIHHPATAACVAAERAFLEALAGGCNAPAAALAQLDGDQLTLDGYLASDPDDPASGRRLRLRSDVLHAVPLGRALAQQLAAGGR
jgi:hydroxymethylbilane synthase